MGMLLVQASTNFCMFINRIIMKMLFLVLLVWKDGKVTEKKGKNWAHFLNIEKEYLNLNLLRKIDVDTF